jgi:hypothetical protein
MIHSENHFHMKNAISCRAALPHNRAVYAPPRGILPRRAAIVQRGSGNVKRFFKFFCFPAGGAGKTADGSSSRAVLGFLPGKTRGRPETVAPTLGWRVHSVSTRPGVGLVYAP